MYNKTNIFYRGVRVLDAVINYLLQSAGMAQANRIILSGASGKIWRNLPESNQTRILNYCVQMSSLEILYRISAGTADRNGTNRLEIC